MRILTLVIILFLSLPSPLLAEGRGGTRGGHQGPPFQEEMGRGGQQMEMQEWQRHRIRATEQEHNQYRLSLKYTERVRTQARIMEQTAKGSDFKSTQALEQHRQLRNEIQTMHQEHVRFMQGLNSEQREALKARIRNTNQIQERVNSCLEVLDREFQKNKPHQKRISQQAREIERAMKEWHEEYRKMGSDMWIQ